MREWQAGHPKANLMARKRAAILDAAKSSFLKEGYAGTTMESVATLANVSVKTVYRHFDDKDDLFSNVISTACNSATDEPQYVLSGPPATMLARLASNYLGRITLPDEVALYRMIVREAQRFPELGKRFYTDVILGRNVPLSSYLNEQQQIGSLLVPNPLGSAFLFAGMLRAGPFERLLLGIHQSVSSDELEKHARFCTDAFLGMHTISRKD